MTRIDEEAAIARKSLEERAKEDPSIKDENEEIDLEEASDLRQIEAMKLLKGCLGKNIV